MTLSTKDRRGKFRAIRGREGREWYRLIILPSCGQACLDFAKRSAFEQHGHDSMCTG